MHIIIKYCNTKNNMTLSNLGGSSWPQESRWFYGPSALGQWTSRPFPQQNMACIADIQHHGHAGSCQRSMVRHRSRSCHIYTVITLSLPVATSA
jgi:hypothetical protein